MFLSHASFVYTICSSHMHHLCIRYVPLTCIICVYDTYVPLTCIICVYDTYVPLTCIICVYDMFLSHASAAFIISVALSVYIKIVQPWSHHLGGNSGNIVYDWFILLHRVFRVSVVWGHWLQSMGRSWSSLDGGVFVATLINHVGLGSWLSPGLSLVGSAVFCVLYFSVLLIDRQLRDEHQVWEDWKKYCDYSPYWITKESVT